MMTTGTEQNVIKPELHSVQLSLFDYTRNMIQVEYFDNDNTRH